MTEANGWSWGVFFATYGAHTLMFVLFGLIPTLWMGTVAFAYCIGVLYGAGSQIRKQQEKDAAARFPTSPAPTTKP